MDWYAVTTAPQAEFKVAAALRERGLQTLVPVEYKWRRKSPHSPHKKKKAYPVFTRYVFVGFESQPQWYPLADIEPRPIKAICFNGQPAKLTARDVGYLSSFKAGALATNPHKAIQVGKPAQVATGPFAGYTALVETISGERAKMALSIFGDYRPVEIPLAALEAA